MITVCENRRSPHASVKRHTARFGDADDRICLMSGRVGSAHRRWLDERVLVLGDGQEGLDRTTLVHSGVGVGDVVEVGGVVEHEAGVDASGEDVVE